MLAAAQELQRYFAIEILRDNRHQPNQVLGVSSQHPIQVLSTITMSHHQKSNRVLFVVLMAVLVGLSCWDILRSGSDIRGTTELLFVLQGRKQVLYGINGTYDKTATNDSQMGFLEIADSGNHVMQTIVVSPEPGLLFAWGTTEYHKCPLPNYRKEDFRLLSMDENKTFDTVHCYYNEKATLGPLLSATFRVPHALWQNLILDGGGKLKLLNLNSNTLQEMQVLVDPALTARKPKHFLSATTTIRKSYRYYQGGALSNNFTKPFAWNDEEILRRLNVWLEHHRSLGIQHFFIIDNEHDIAKPNLQLLSNSNVTYIRSPYTVYDFWNCQHQDYTVTGQGILENSVIRMAHTEWLLVLDIDEFIVVGDRYNNSLVNLVAYFQHVYCNGYYDTFNNLTCHPLHMTTYQQTYAIMFTSIFLNNMNRNETRVEFGWRMKGLLRTSLVEMLAVHYPLSIENSRYTKTRVPPQQAWMGHFNNKLAYVNSTDAMWKELLSGLPHLTTSMRSQ